jgi:hypothetical protein
MAKKKGSFGNQAKVAGGVLILMLAAHGMKGHHGHGVLANLDSIGSSNLSTPGGWARAFLAEDGMPETHCDKLAMRIWMGAEGGGFGNQATNDPLNLNPGPSAGWPGQPAIGAWAFPNTPAGQADGLRYSVATVQNYGGIQDALRAGDSAQNVLTQVEDSPWAQSHYGYGLSAPPC